METQWKYIENEPRRKYGKKLINEDLKMNIEDQISQQTISTEASFQILGS